MCRSGRGNPRASAKGKDVPGLDKGLQEEPCGWSRQSKGERCSERRQKLDHTGPHDLRTIAASWAKDGHDLS